MEERTCRVCNVVKDIDRFTKRLSKVKKHITYRHKCKKCTAEKMREDRKNNGERFKGYDKKRSKTEVRRYSSLISSLRRDFNMTEQDKRDLMDKQKGVCAICQRSLINPKYHKADCHIDHDHDTEEIRGLLCSNCNTGLGVFKDNKELLQRAIQYLEI